MKMMNMYFFLEMNPNLTSFFFTYISLWLPHLFHFFLWGSNSGREKKERAAVLRLDNKHRDK